MTATAGWRPRAVNVPCTVDLADTVESLHAHVELDGINVEPGDAVLVHDAPTAIDPGERLVCARRATVTRAGPFGRWWTRFTSRFELTLLYEVSFQPGRPGVTVPRKPR
jgi:hypothetical protein